MTLANDAASMWNERYKEPEYFYGTEPNDFLRENYYNIVKNGRVLCIADGEGRNSVFLASLGYKVTAIDVAEEGLKKAQKLAQQKGTQIESICADINTFPLGTACWDGIVLIFVHLPFEERQRMFGHIVQALKPGGCVLMEAYTPDQLQYGTGGPKTEDLLMTSKELQKACTSLKIAHLKEVKREIFEGQAHQGLSATVQLIAIKNVHDE